MRIEDILHDAELKKNLVYSSKDGSYTYKGAFVFNESDMDLNTINLVKNILDKTVMTDKEFEILYDYSTRRFNNKVSPTQFLSQPLKTIFPGASKDQLVVDKLIPQAVSYLKNNKNKANNNNNQTSEEYNYIYGVNGSICNNNKEINNTIEGFESNTSGGLSKLSSICCGFICVFVLIFLLVQGWNMYGNNI